MASSSAAVRFAACAATSCAEVGDLIYECIGRGRQFATQMTLVMRILCRQRRAAQKPTGRARHHGGVQGGIGSAGNGHGTRC